MKYFRLLVLVGIPLLLAGNSASEETFPGKYEFGGWIRVDYGNGDRYDEADGEDNLGVSQAALLGTWKHKNFEAVLLLGGTNLTADDNDGDGDFGIKDAFIVWKEIGGTNFRLTAGVQPLFFGLKSNGFPGDRSLQPSLEFGGAGGFSVSQQAGPSVLLHYDANEFLTISGGLFDTNSSTASDFPGPGLGRIDGSSLDKNYIVQLKLKPVSGETGFYLFAGIEGRYIGDEIDSTEPILDLGVGFKGRKFDLSVEAIQLDQAFTRTADDETYGIAELTLYPSERVRLYFDYATAEELDRETLRAGIKYNISEPVTFAAEYSQDEFGSSVDSISSVDIRLQFSF